MVSVREGREGREVKRIRGGDRIKLLREKRHKLVSERQSGRKRERYSKKQRKDE